MIFCHIVSLDEGHIAGLKSQEDEGIHYASVTVPGCSQGETGWKTALTYMCSLQLEMYVKYMTMINFPGTDSWFKMKPASSEVCCETPTFINSSYCKFDLLMMHVQWTTKKRIYLGMAITVAF